MWSDGYVHEKKEIMDMKSIGDFRYSERET